MNEFHFNINLNKFGELTQKKQAETRLFKNLVLGFAIGSVVLYGGVLYSYLSLNRKYENRTNLLREINQEIQTYRDSGEYLSTNDLERLARTSTERIFWAHKLIALAEITTDKIAITHFSYKNGVLSLFGITQVDVEEREFDLINEFIDDLNVNEQIDIDFDEVRFVRSSRDREKDVQIIRFQIDLIGRDIPARDRRRL
jgi:hypothetical protein